MDISEPHFFQRGRRKNLMQNGSSGRPFFYQVRIGVGFRYPDWPACYQCQLCAYKAGLHPALRDFQKCENLDSQWNSYGGISRAVHRLCVIGSPREATEKFYAKRSSGRSFFDRVTSGRVIRGNPIAPLDANATMRQFKHPEIRLFDGIYLCQQCQVNICRGYNCPWGHFCENLRERLLDS